MAAHYTHVKYLHIFYLLFSNSLYQLKNKVNVLTVMFSPYSLVYVNKINCKKIKNKHVVGLISDQHYFEYFFKNRLMKVCAV